MWFGDHIHHIAQLKHGVVLRDEGVLSAMEGGDAEVDVLVLFGDFADGLSDDLGSFFEFHHEQLQLAS